MTKKEALRLMAIMTVAYPNYRLADIDFTATTWADMLPNYTYDQVEAALKAYILSENTGFPPSIGQINEKLVALSQSDTPTPLEAWSLVRIAVRNSTYHADDEFAKLPPIIQSTVGNARNLEEWAKGQATQFETVIHSNFLRSYSAEIAKQKECQKLQGKVSIASEQPEYLPELNI
jgi:hypothetical protein